MSADKPRRLGRGLEALIGSNQPSATSSSDLQRLPIAKIRPNPFQPRTEFAPGELSELQASIAASGLLQPITVRKKGDSYELIAGERRLRATTNLGWRDIPAIVRDFDDQTLLVLALVENLQRADLNPLEEARGYQRLLGEFGLTHQQVADAVGKDRTTITNLLRILQLPTSLQQAVEQGRLSAGHAKALLGLEDPRAMLELAQAVEAHGLSVRETEQHVRDHNAGSGEAERRTKATSRKAGSAPSDASAKAVEEELRKYFQTDVQLHLSGKAKGAIRIAFYSNDDLDRLLDLMLREHRHSY